MINLYLQVLKTPEVQKPNTETLGGMSKKATIWQ